MKETSEFFELNTKSFFLNCSKEVPLCKEYIFTPQNGFHFYKGSLTILCILFTIYYIVFMDYKDSKEKYSIVSVLTVLSLVLVISLCCTVVKETLLLVVPLTLQMTTSYLFWTESTLSLPWHALGDFMIMEVIIGQRIKYFLSIAINIDTNEKIDHVILFRNTQPPFKYLEKLYRDLQIILDKNR